MVAEKSAPNRKYRYLGFCMDRKEHTAGENSQVSTPLTPLQPECTCGSNPLLCLSILAANALRQSQTLHTFPTTILRTTPSRRDLHMPKPHCILLNQHIVATQSPKSDGTRGVASLVSNMNKNWTDWDFATAIWGFHATGAA